MEEAKMSQYYQMLDMNYNDAVTTLLEKYGAAQSSFFSETSYNNFLNGEIKNLKKRKSVSRSDEGLYCHHMDEDNYSNLANPHAISRQRLPFSTQDKNVLVYCDLIEHAILHKLIKANGNIHSDPRGLISKIKVWYIDEKIPTSDKSEMKCYMRSKLTVDDAQSIYDALTK